mgnify:CR=1 FL=1
MEQKSIKWWRRGLFVLSIALSFFILLTSIVNKKYDLKAADIAPVDFKANVDVVDKLTTEALVADAVSSVQRQYKKDDEVRRNILKLSNDFFNGIINARNPLVQVDEIAMLLTNKGTYGIDKAGYLSLLNLDNTDLRYALNTMNDSLNKIYETPLEEDDATKIDRSKTGLSEMIDSFGFSDSAKTAIKQMTASLVQPNFFYDEETTLRLQKEAKDSINPIVIKKNQTIVKEGDPISVNQLSVLKELGYLSDSGTNYLPFLGLFGVIFFLHVLIYYYFRRFYNLMYNNLKWLVLIFLIMNLTLLTTRFMVIINPFMVPYAFMPMLITILTKKRIAQTMALFTSILMSILTGFNVQVIIILVLTSALSVIFMNKVEERNDIIKSSLYVGSFVFIFTLSMGMLLSSSVQENLNNALYASGSIIISGVLVIGVLPVIENLFNVVTEIKLLELANPNSPLLKRLQMEAPGTYHHSIMVGNLAEAAAEELRANSILLRVSAYYHDIGKLSRPQFFKENQIGSKNPHDEISPNLSTLIITNHVKIGLEMADKAKLPEEIKDMIAQHHGTTLVKYFYITMKNNSDDESKVLEENFRYPGPKPKTKEAGILMLADSVEAAVRSIQEPTSGKVDAMVYRIFKDKLDDGQLDECDITFDEVSSIRKVFLKTLGSIYHERIEYPEDKRKKA